MRPTMSFRNCGIAIAAFSIVFGYFGRSRLGGPTKISDQDAGDGQQKLHPDHDARTLFHKAEVASEQRPVVFSQAHLDNVFKDGQDPQGFWLPTKVPSCAGRWIHESPKGIFATKGYDPLMKKSARVCMRAMLLLHGLSDSPGKISRSIGNLIPRLITSRARMSSPSMAVAYADIEARSAILF
eukprot:gnl/MRDRNA2_/MRDRNA2_20267_c0_seq1.p1 gnl/MRDRNA2_/MRDRNA2_20267_c0~~gnl/MRDRNA2_/MRDRNA2_20267_c0_seq1.p1  ORF type:complete len:183 (-),score=25.29 gnl/MRDRNA2_/MRDRNA2_20267_c0_seq1:312-860(-)